MSVIVTTNIKWILELDEDNKHDQSSAQEPPIMLHAHESLAIEGEFQGKEGKVMLPFLEAFRNNVTKLKCPGEKSFFNKAVYLFTESPIPPSKSAVPNGKIAEMIQPNRCLKGIDYLGDSG
ncbi:hypothetical protein BGZ93_008010, partial [Podila epicladia]